MAQIQSLAWELPYAMGMAIKKKKKKKKPFFALELYRNCGLGSLWIPSLAQSLIQWREMT